jgi:hypothetical protein
VTEVFKGATSQSFMFELVDSTTGLPKTGIVYTDVTASYARTRSARVAITPATLASASSSYSSGGFIEVDATNQPGLYRVDVPNNAFASGAEEVVVTIKATGCRTQSRGFTLVDWNKQVAAIPNAAANASGGLLTFGTGAGQFNPSGGSVLLSAAAVQSIWDALTSALTTNGSIGKLVSDIFARLGAPAGASLAVDLAAILTAIGTRAAPGSAMTLTSGERTAIANAVEAEIIDETDSEKVLTAITNKIASVNPDLGGLTVGAIASAVLTAMSDYFKIYDSDTIGKKLIGAQLEETEFGISTASLNSIGALITALGASIDGKDFATVGTKLASMIEFVAAVNRFKASAVSQVPAGGGGGGGDGATAAQVWAHPDRTLTSFPPTMQAATPHPGVGLFLPGARLEGGPVSYRGSSLAGSTISLRARVVGTDGDWIQQADVSAVESIVVNLQDASDTDTDSHTVADVVFDELRADGTWTEDSVGYNVAVDIDGDRLPAAGTAYRVTLTLTTAAGPIKTLWEIQTTAS